MRHWTWSLARVPAMLLGTMALALATAFAAEPGGAEIPVVRGSQSVGGRIVSSSWQPSIFPSFGGFNGFNSPIFSGPYYPGPYLPKYWWTGYYSVDDPRQAGYNPSAGYDWDSVGTLILQTSPTNARVTLDGVFVGTTNRLGPFQLPIGEHTLCIEALGFEPSDNVLRVESPVVQQLDVHLNPSSHGGIPAKPGPKF